MRAITAATFTTAMITASQALAAARAVESEGIGILAACFIGFGAMIVLFQFIPGILMMAGILKGILSLGSADAHQATTTK
ncbi:MAG: hypothetical protein RW306_13925 [Geobacteraceae bacterium]|nr:hypothetical protein [Geobacteraceae bacterium]